MGKTSDAATGKAGEQHNEESAEQGQPKPDVSDQGADELLPKLLDYFHSNREELAGALGVDKSSVDEWLDGASHPNNSTLLRMRRLAQERRVE